MTRQRQRGPGLQSTGNRALLSVFIGWLAWLLARSLGFPLAPQLVVLALVAVVTYVLLTAIVSRRS